MSEEKKKKDFDEQTLARVLEAAYVLQEHQHELEEWKSSLDLKRKGSNAESAAAAKTASPPPVATPVVASSTVVSPTPVLSSSQTVSTAPIVAPAVPPASIAAPVPPASSPAPVAATVAAKSNDSILVQVMEIQNQVAGRRLDLNAAMSLIVGQVIEICGAAGAAIGILNRQTVVYRSVAGIRTLPAESEVSVDKALCAPCLQSGEVWRCRDTHSENVRQRDECRRRGIGSLIAAPMFHEGKSVGALELLFSDRGAFTEQDVQTCQLMAGIITESLSRDPERWKDAPAAKPALTAETAKAEEAEKERRKSAPEATESYKCYRCRHVLLAGEQFCGECGTPRSGDYEPVGIQSKVASLWHMQESRKSEPPANVQLDELSPEPNHDLAQAQLKTILNPPDRPKRNAVPHFGLHDAETSDGAESQAAASIEAPDTKPASEINASAPRTNKALEELIASPPPPVRADWSSATSARDFLEHVADVNQRNVLVRFWNTRRGDIYLAIAVILIACVIRWGIWSNRPESPKPSPTPTPAASAPPKTTEPDLPLSERMLIALGLADAPEPPADKGNPSTQVWVDLHTALYYCPGADLYGKTATGKYTTQREAELDQFQPAYRKTCD